MKNLTRAEAEARAALIDVASYDIALDLTGAGQDGAAHFTSVTTVRFTCREAGASTFAELDGELLAATLDGRDVTLDGRIQLLDLSGDHELVVHARCAYSRTGEGLHRFVDPADGRIYLYAQSFLDDAQRIFACFDQPDLKAVVRLVVEAPPDWTVVGNARGRREGQRWTFAPTEPISTYLFTVAAGEWHSVHGRHDGIALGLHCRRSLAPYLDADAVELLEITGQCLDFQQERFGRRYPFGDTYDQLFVPEFNAGAMENPGAVTFRDQFLFRSRVTDDKRRERAMVVAHEMAHMWFGDLVTMRWWDDLWLNESFAELLGYLTVDRATRFDGVWVDFSTGRKAWGYRADQLPSTHPVQGDVADSRSALLNFDGISYAKGASVLRQLMATLGEDAFIAGVRAYVARNAFRNTRFEDLLAELQAAAGRELHDWARAWLQTSGVSTLRVQGGVLAQQATVLRPHRLFVGRYDRTDQVLARRDRLDVELAAEPVPLPADEPADLVLPNDGDLTFAKVRLDPRSLATALADVRRLADPLTRAVVWGSLWDSCRDADLPAARFVQAVLDGVDVEIDPAVVATLLEQARTAATLFVADGSALRERLADASWKAAADADAGSDLQLVRLTACASVAPASFTGRLRAVLDGSAVPAGLVVDTDLRWHLVTALARLGALGDDEIAAEQECDDTAAGRLHALTARAARPDAAAKSRAWQAAVHDTSLSAYETEALAAGIWVSGQDELLRPYVQRYVDDLPGVWRARTPQVATDLARRLFPSTLVTDAVLETIEPLLGEQHPPGLRRYVSEGRDELARARRAVRAGP